MAYPNQILISALRQTAYRLRDGAYYAWGHHGGCNCGNLLQVLTKLTKEEILQCAQEAHGEWTELAIEYCETTNTPLSRIISELKSVGLTNTDIHNLEWLEDREVLEKLPGGFRWLRKNLREDTILYFETFANLLESKLPEKCMSTLSSKDLLMHQLIPQAESGFSS
jgi:hypothetical protein